MPASWLDSRLEIRASPLHGQGTFATAPIRAGEIVTIWEHSILSPAEVDSAHPGELWPRRDGTYIWSPPDDAETAEHFLNHCCDPNV